MDIRNDYTITLYYHRYDILGSLRSYKELDEFIGFYVHNDMSDVANDMGSF